MSAVPVAEILGWRYCSRGRHYIPPELDGEDHCSRAVTPDDMLAWLRGKLGWDRFDLEQTRDGWRVVIDIENDEYFSEILCPADAPAPTLHAALEAAVLAIHEARP